MATDRPSPSSRLKVEVIDGWHIASVTYGSGAGEYFLARGRTEDEAVSRLRDQLGVVIEAGRLAQRLVAELF